MGAGGSKPKEGNCRFEHELDKSKGYSDADIKEGRVHYKKNFNIHGESDYDDEVDSVVGDEDMEKVEENFDPKKQFDDIKDEDDKKKLLEGEEGSEEEDDENNIIFSGEEDDGDGV
jgi:hypothetical protein